MLELLGDLLIYGVAVAASPLPLVAVLLLRRSEDARAAASAFLGARVLVLFVVVLLVAALAELLPAERSGTSAVVTALRIGLGITLIVIAIRKWMQRPRVGERAAMPAWMRSVSESSVAGAARLGVVLSAANPKELAFGAGAGLTVAAAGLGVAQTLLTTLIYTLIACIGVLIIVVAVFTRGGRTAQALEAAEKWLVQNYSVALGAVLLLIGVTLIGEALGAI